MKPISDWDFAVSLGLVADTIMKADGDRDYMNPSDLNVQQTTAVADLLREAANRLRAIEAARDAYDRGAHIR